MDVANDIVYQYCVVHSTQIHHPSEQPDKMFSGSGRSKTYCVHSNEWFSLQFLSFKSKSSDPIETVDVNKKEVKW